MRGHQDIQAWPHTNFGVLTFGVYLDDTGPEQGPLTALPGTHRGPIFDQWSPTRPGSRPAGICDQVGYRSIFGAQTAAARQMTPGR